MNKKCCLKNNVPNVRMIEMTVETSTTSTKSKRTACTLKYDTLNLEDILSSLNGPIGQEEAWAVCHQTAKVLSKLASNHLQELTCLKEIVLHTNGHVILNLRTDSTTTYSSEKKVISSLGVLLYKALDFGLDQNQERCLSLELRELIKFMTNYDGEYELDDRLRETDDERIGRDLDAEGDDIHLSSTNSFDRRSLKNIIKMCNKRIQLTEECANNHYQDVIRVFIHDTFELTKFLNEVAVERFQANLQKFQSDVNERLSLSTSKHLDILDIDDWARFWVQVIGELHRGIKLKKVETSQLKRNVSNSRAGEFELTPYEILMNDIRERRYHLKKTPMSSNCSHKDAHDILLEFIRSRPPLKKASERQLAPIKQELTIRELLMESIREQPQSLKSYHDSQSVEIQKVTDTKCHKDSEAGIRTKKVIPVDFRLKFGGEDDADDDDFNDEYAVTRFDDNDESDVIERKLNLSTNFNKDNEHNDGGDDGEKGSANPWKQTGGLRLTQNEYHRFCDAQLESYDLATQYPSRRATIGKHTGVGNMASFISFGQRAPFSCSRTLSHQRTIDFELAPKAKSNPNANTTPGLGQKIKESAQLNCQVTGEAGNDRKQLTKQKPSLGDMFLDERLSLTLEEIVHIRSVLTKAELESLPVEGRVKEDVEKRRICFLCLKTRFGFWGPRGQRCRLCERTVCHKCCSRMQMPTEQFAHVPVVLLSPALLSPSESVSSKRNGWSGHTVGSAPASPAYRRRETGLKNSTPLSTPNSSTPADNLTPSESILEKNSAYPRINKSPSGMTSSAIGNLGPGCNEQRLAAETIRSMSMIVCHDCRIMVKQIIKSSRSTRQMIRNNVISRLTLNLSPAYV